MDMLLTQSCRDVYPIMRRISLHAFWPFSIEETNVITRSIYDVILLRIILGIQTQKNQHKADFLEHDTILLSV